MSKNTNLSFLTDYITADITNGRIGINNASPTVAFDVTGVAKFSSSVGIGNPSTIEGVLTIKGTSAQPPTSGTTANSLLQLVGSLGAELNIGSNTVAGGYGSYIQASDNNLAVPYPLNLQPNGGSVGIGNGTGTVGTLNVTGRIALTSSLFFSSNLTSEDRWEINVATPANDLYFSRSGVGERMRILSNGNVGIGTSSPSDKLSVVGGGIYTDGSIYSTGRTKSVGGLISADAYIYIGINTWTTFYTMPGIGIYSAIINLETFEDINQFGAYCVVFASNSNTSVPISFNGTYVQIRVSGMNIQCLLTSGLGYGRTMLYKILRT